ncbi:MAG: aldo/keto reductase [Actinomycetales bacterium]|nr:aldo/keto reductase [Actinomycetales bacterium]
MQTRELGRSGLRVSAVGLGCMPMSSSYGPADPVAAADTLERALELGVTFWDTAEAYGWGANEELLAPLLGRHRADIVVATKFGFRREGGNDGSPENARRAIDACLQRLGTDHVDVWYLHRVDPGIPIEETVGAMAEAVAAGKARHLGLSEASADSLRRASAVHPIAALQSEWSLWTRDLEEEVLPVARELGIGIVPYSPLGRGMFTGTLNDVSALAENDFRRRGPRFDEGNFAHNRRLVQRIEELADGVGCRPGQLALAWVLAQGPDVVPIPGTSKVAHLEENAAASELSLTPDQVEELGSLLAGIHGGRYNTPHAYGDSPAQTTEVDRD